VGDGLVFWLAAKKVYEACRKLGLCRSQRDFSRRLLGRGQQHLRLVTNRRGCVSQKTTEVLKKRLASAAYGGPLDSPSSRGEILAEIDRAAEMARWLRLRD
jgi:hypothetical protein